MEDVFKEYREIGISSLELACGCAVKVDLETVVYPAIRELRRRLLNKRFDIPSKRDAEIVGAGRKVEVHRRVYKLGFEMDMDLNDIRSINPQTCVAVFQVFQRYAGSYEKFTELLEPIYKRISESGANLRFGKGHSIVTTAPEESIAIFDFITVREPIAGKLLAINNDTVNIIDPTIGIGDKRQVIGALCNALNDLFVLGVHKELRVAPLIGVLDSSLRDKMIGHARNFCRELEFEFVDVPQFNSRRLFIGGTVLGTTEKQPPTREELVKPGMDVVVTRPFGELSPITVYVSSLIDGEVASEVESRGIPLDELKRMKERAVEIISSPNIRAAKVVSEYLPKIGEGFNVEEHIPLASDISGPGIYIFAEIAERTNTSIEVSEVPLLFPEVSEYAAERFLMANATAGTNGAFLLITHENITEDVVKDFSRAGYSPRVIGKVRETGLAKVRMPKEVLKYVTNIANPIIEVGD